MTILTIQRTLSIWRDAPRELFKIDIEVSEAFQASLRGAVANLLKAHLMVRVLVKIDYRNSHSRNSRLSAFFTHPGCKRS